MNIDFLDTLPLWWYILSMRVKTSVSLSSDVLTKVNQYVIGGERSEFIEKAIWNYIEYIRRNERNLSDLQKINDSASFLNNEANDFLNYQVPL